MAKSAWHTDVFSYLGEQIPRASDVNKGLDTFVCTMHGKSQLEFSNDERFAYFQQYYAPQRADDPLERIQVMNPSSMPRVSMYY